jgi:hypothetical protein
MTERQTRRAYIDGSPYLRAIIDRYGWSLTGPVAERIAADHGTTVAELELPRESDDRIDPVTLVRWLGY